jgi:hypothetical protein
MFAELTPPQKKSCTAKVYRVVSLRNGDGKPRQLIKAANQLAARFSLLSEEELSVCVRVRES